MANTFLTPSIIAREALRLFKANVVASGLFARDHEQEFTGAQKVGDTISIRRRGLPTAETFSGSITEQELTETAVTLQLENHYDTSIKVTSKDRLLELQDFNSQILAPAINVLTRKIEVFALTKALDAPSHAPAGNPAAVITTIGGLATIRKIAMDQEMRLDDLFMITDTSLDASLLGIDAIVTSDKKGDDGTALRNASLGSVLQMSFFASQNWPTATHTPGTSVSGTVNGALVAGDTTLVLAGMGNALTCVAGDELQIAGYGSAIIDALATSSAGGAMTVVIREPLREDVATSTAVVNFRGGEAAYYNHGVLFNPEAFALAVVPLPQPMSGGIESFVAQDDGYALRVTFDWNRAAKTDVMSIDVLVGCEMIDGRACTRVITSGA